MDDDDDDDDVEERVSIVSNQYFAVNIRPILDDRSSLQGSK